MTKKRMIYLVLVVALVGVGTLAWNLTARAAYESAEYTVVETDGEFEVRDYPELMLVSTATRVDAQGRDGSFMRLFRYISGGNEADQKVAMTTPVFMEDGEQESAGKMGFVIPKNVVSQGVPEPTAEGVSIRKRKSGRFAVIRFSGRMNAQKADEAEAKLRAWIREKGFQAAQRSESAGYDPPFTPGPLRRNEILIRLRTTVESANDTINESPTD